MESKLGRLGTAGAAAALAFSVGAELAPDQTAEAGGGSVKRVSCKKFDAWYPLKPDQVLVVDANAVTLPADVKVNGVVQYDNDADTSTVVGMFSKDKETIRVANDFGGSAHVLACGTSRAEFYEDLGRQAAILDRRNDKNNPDKRVNLNVIFK